MDFRMVQEQCLICLLHLILQTHQLRVLVPTEGKVKAQALHLFPQVYNLGLEMPALLLLRLQGKGKSLVISLKRYLEKRRGICKEGEINKFDKTDMQQT